MIYVLAYPVFDATIAQSLAQFRRMHEPDRARLVAPHVTLVFGVRKSSADDIMAICARVAACTAPISTSFTTGAVSYDPFENTYKISLLCGVGAKRLTALHHMLYQGPHRDEFDDTMPFRPHMTVGTNKARSALASARFGAIGAFPILAGINRLSVVRRAGGAVHSIGSVALSG